MNALDRHYAAGGLSISSLSSSNLEKTMTAALCWSNLVDNTSIYCTFVVSSMFLALLLNPSQVSRPPRVSRSVQPSSGQFWEPA